MFEKNIICAGAGKSGIQSAKLLLRNNAKVTIYDQNKDLNVEELLNKFEGEKPEVVVGDLTDELLNSSELMILSPGIPCDAEFVNKAREVMPIWGEIELANHFNKGCIAGITGTNGKTTTTTLVGEIFKNYNEDTIVVGNIGTPFTTYADKTTEKTLVAAEISSFQLETVHTFKPHVSAILNLTPDHLNRHYTFDNYAACKFRIQENATEDDYIVLNFDDPETKKRANLVKKARIVWFSRVEELSDGVFVKDGHIVCKWDGKEEILLDISDIKIPGDHNVENVLAAAAVAHFMDIPSDVIKKTVQNFMGVEHRIEYVKDVKGVRYYNDSKGTNPDAAIKAIKAMTTPTLLIGGGYDKKSTYDEWIEAFDGKVRFLVLIGVTAPAIAECAKRHGFNDIVFKDNLKEAVKFCYENANEGDTVLLSPACASWDQFKSYEERGELFKEYVRELEE